MTDPRRIVVVGASLAGVATARALRAHGYDGDVTLVGEEPHRPYDRPPLSKGFLAGTMTTDDLGLDDGGLDAQWLLGTRAVALDPGTRRVTLASGATVDGDVVVIATGSHARRLPGDPLPGVHTLRTLDDALALRAELVPGVRLVLVGAGFVGAEIASTARSLGLEVTVVEAAPAPLAGPLGVEVGAMVARLHDAHGVPLVTGVAVDALVGRDRVEGVALADGRVLPADVVVVGVGSVAATDWLASSGLSLEAGGVACDAVGGTDAPGVWAVGDVAAWHDPSYTGRRRIEHWTDSLQRPTRTAAAILGSPVDTPLPAPYFWSEQYGVQIQYAGRRLGDETVTVEAGSPETADVLAVYRRGETPVAVLGMNQPRLFGRTRRQLAAPIQEFA